MVMKVKSKGLIFSLLFFVLLQSCKTKQIYSTQSNPFEIKSEIIVNDMLELDSRYIIYPTAFIKTAGKGKLVIKEPICILGKSQVFDTDINIDFKPFTISEIYPEWFGAKGYDQLDDTKAFKKVISVAKKCYNSLNILVSSGIFYISETLELENNANFIKSINLLGASMSTSSSNGSSLIWNGVKGGTLLKVSYLNLSRIENLDFGADQNNGLMYNIDLKPIISQLSIKNCSFAGCEGKGSTNISLNIGNGVQVSEITFENCSFRSKTLDGKNWLTDAAIGGGIDNVLNFYVKTCSFMGYQNAAVNIKNSSTMVVENSTFAYNDVDIKCMLCGLYASSNFSEHSKAFFQANSSSNYSSAFLINNYFTGDAIDGYVIRDGAGSLFLINNNFGGSGYDSGKFKIKWEERTPNPIFSFGNFFKNIQIDNTPFYNRSNQIKKNDIISTGDIGGKFTQKMILLNKEK
jgi:hypothetical protein